jgi:hypothetical protein
MLTLSTHSALYAFTVPLRGGTTTPRHDDYDVKKATGHAGTQRHLRECPIRLEIDGSTRWRGRRPAADVGRREGRLDHKPLRSLRTGL